MAFVPVTAGVAPALPDTFTAAFAPVTAGAAPGPADTFTSSFIPATATLNAGLASQSLTVAASVVGAAGALPTRAGIQINPISPDLEFPNQSLDNTYGAFLLGTFFGILLYGYSLHQLSAYFRRFPSDTTLIRISVTLTHARILETAFTALTIHTSYFYLVTNFHDFVRLNRGVWSFSAAIMFTSQLFFARRVSLMGRRYMFVAATAMLFFTAEVGMYAIPTSGDVTDHTLSPVSVYQGFVLIPFSFWEFTDVNVVIAALFGSAVGGDTLLTTSLIVELQRTRLSEARRKESRWDTALIYVLNTGLLHDALNIITFILDVREAFFSTASQELLMSGLVYSNTLLAVLNSRQLPATIEVVGGGFGINSIERARRHAKQDQWNTPHVLESSPGSINVAIATEEISDKLAQEKIEQEKWRDSSSTLDSVTYVPITKANGVGLLKSACYG
ncbi:hypothetical protein L226DRAFT_597082 [Lentinus tigrinus ALCF2SS1-7]|uniref:uncharacterized protein n=1 Tax=Lentinus tigrinus ALCF2SS1-7 TaxID=1328758 RepID=UPI0011663835|nr:hypothetical protein L226DRAFT_597082 [Lentinus tigrinus ALCF2SS1-7]